MNRKALRYWFDGNDVPAEEHEWGFAIASPGTVGNDLVRELGACGAALRTGTAGQLLIVDPDAVEDDA